MPFDIASLYDTARSVLDQVVHEDGSIERLNEIETRTHVIDPFIKAMGYETLDQVRREYHLSASGHFIDYMLTAGDQRVVVEAKPLGTELSAKESSQLVGYCAQEGIRWALLTNGLAWIVFDTEISGNWEAKQITTIDLLGAYRSGRLAAAVGPLGHFALETLSVDDQPLREWAHEERARAKLDQLLSDPSSAVVAALVTEMSDGGVSVEPDDVIALIRRGTDESRRSQSIVEPSRSPPPDRGRAAYLFPAGDQAGYSGVDHLKHWLNAGFWGVGASTGYRTRLKPGDPCCFYATKIGVVATARIAGLADAEVRRDEWPGPGEFSSGSMKVPLSHVEWLRTPLIVDKEMRATLDAFSGKDLTKQWSWFVQSTCGISEHDLRILTGRK